MCVFSLPRFKIDGGHGYEEKIRHAEAKEKRRLEQEAKAAGGRWQVAGRGSIRLDAGKILSSRGRGEAGTLGARKFKITKGGNAAAKASVAAPVSAGNKPASSDVAEK